LTSITSLRTLSTSPGRVERSHEFYAPTPTNAAGDRRAALDPQEHRQRGGVPTAGDQFAEQGGARGCFLVEVKRLRIEPRGEGRNFVFGNGRRMIGSHCRAIQHLQSDAIPCETIPLAHDAASLAPGSLVVTDDTIARPVLLWRKYRTREVGAAS
jgi:hypothetical protein